MKSYPILPYGEWPADPRARELEAQHTFGMHLFQHVVDVAAAELPAGLSDEARQASLEAIDHSVALFLSLLEGIPLTPVGDSGAARYVLTAEFYGDDPDTPEVFGIAPEGDGVLMGYAGWKIGDFGQEQRRRRQRTEGT